MTKLHCNKIITVDKITHLVTKTKLHITSIEACIKLLAQAKIMLDKGGEYDNQILKDKEYLTDFIFLSAAGLLAYLNQFGLEKELSCELSKILDEFCVEQNIVCRYDLECRYSSTIERYILAFAKADKMISKELHEWINYNLNRDPESTFIVDKDLNSQPIKEKQKSENNIGMPAPDIDGKFIPSILSNGGFIVSKLDVYTEEFVKYAINCTGKTLTIGSGYGIPERISLLAGAQNIVCNDVCKEHLNVINNLTPQNHRAKLFFAEGAFPYEINIADGSINLLGIFRVLHFFEPDLLLAAIKKAYDILAPDGILILSAETPYIKNWQKFLPEYEQRKLNNTPWPGYIANTTSYETDGYSKKLPPQMHFLDIDVVNKLLVDNGFSVLKCTTFSRDGTFPANMLLNGNESVGAIARKITE